MRFNLLQGMGNKAKKTASGSAFWSALGNLQNSSYTAKVAGSRLQQSLKRDIEIRDAITVLRQARANFNRFGATESAMAIFNQNDQLAKSLEMSIPKVTSVNAAEISRQCSKRISKKIGDTVKHARHHANTIVAQTSTLINKTHALAEDQKKILEILYNRVANSIRTVNARQFSSTRICGYTMPIFIERAEALQYIVDNLHRCSSLAQCKKLFTKQFSVLNWTINEDGEITETDPEEVAEQAPDQDEVMNPVVDPESGDPITEDDEPELVEPAPIEEDEVVPASVPQEQAMAVFGWNPATIKRAAATLHKLVGSTSQFAKVYKNMRSTQSKLGSSVESYNSAIEKNQVMTAINNYRRYNTFIGNALCNYNTAIEELIGQVVAMYGVLKDAEVFSASITAVSTKSITAKTPWGLKKTGFLNSDEILTGDAEGEKDGSDVELPGDLEDDVDGPTEAEEPEEGATTDSYFDRKKKKTKKKRTKGMFVYDEDEVLTGDAEGEEDDSDTPLAGDLEDDVEGPTKAEDPEEGATDLWAVTLNQFFDEDEVVPEETADEGDAENEDAVEEEEAEEEAEAAETEEEGDEPADGETDSDEGDESSEEEETPSSESYDYFNEGSSDAEEDDSGTELPGEMEDETEGPTESEEPVEEDGDMPADETETPDSDDQGIVEDPANEEATTVEDYLFYNEDGLPEGDAEGEEDGSGTTLPGDLEDEVDGPTEATDPVDWWNEGASESEEEADEGESSEEDGDEEAEESDSDEEGDESATEEDEGEGDEDAEGADDDEDDDNPMTNVFNEDGDSSAELEEDPGEVEVDPDEEEVDPEDVDPDDGDASASEEEGDDPAEELVPELDSEPEESSVVAEPDEDTTTVEDWWNSDDGIEGPNTPDELPTEPPDTPDGVDPNAEVDIPDAQTEPYIQPESTPPDDIPTTTFDDEWNNYFV